MLFPPNVFNDIRREELFRRPMHPFVFGFNVGPGAFNSLGVSTRRRIHKFRQFD